jgi:hypothetical protein
MTNDVDLLLLAESLLLGAGHALRDIADQLLDLRIGWIARHAAPEAIAWLDDVIGEAAWWCGRIEAAAAEG